MRARLICWGALGAAVLAGGALLCGPPSWVLDRLAARYPGCLYRVPTRVPLIALTLDDGPDPATTPLILAELRRHEARATFFLIAERVQGHGQMAHRLVAEGHEVGNHFTQDRPSIRLAAGEFARDLEQAHRVLAQYGPVRWARPGSGRYSQVMITTMERQGYRCALGSVYPYDATIPSAAFSIGHILRNARPGAILVLHDGGARGRRTARVLRTVLPALMRRGYRIVSLSELVAAAQPNPRSPGERSSAWRYPWSGEIAGEDVPHLPRHVGADIARERLGRPRALVLTRGPGAFSSRS